MYTLYGESRNHFQSYCIHCMSKVEIISSLMRYEVVYCFILWTCKFKILSDTCLIETLNNLEICLNQTFLQFFFSSILMFVKSGILNFLNWTHLIVQEGTVWFHSVMLSCYIHVSYFLVFTLFRNINRSFHRFNLIPSLSIKLE